MRARTLREVLHVVQKAKKDVAKIDEVYPKRYQRELDDIGKTIVADWYKSYDPVFYRRHQSLKHAYRVVLNGTDYEVQFGPELMTESHDVSNEYIYENSFIEGYHGGAREGVGHPNPGIPYWRAPYPALSLWGRPAKRSASPYYRMRHEMENKIKELDKERIGKLNKIMDRVESSVDRLF